MVQVRAAAEAESGYIASMSIWKPAIFLLLPLAATAGDLREERDPATGLSSWIYADNGFSLQLIQLLPEYVNALYSSRGLPKSIVDGMSDYCVFGTVIKNDTPRKLSYRVADWRYIGPGGKPQKPRTKTEWLKEWRKQGSTYQWSILPDDQTFESGDWSQGFTTVKLKPGTAFDLVVHWRMGNEKHQYQFRDLRCAPEKPPVAGAS